MNASSAVNCLDAVRIASKEDSTTSGSRSRNPLPPSSEHSCTCLVTVIQKTEQPSRWMHLVRLSPTALNLALQGQGGPCLTSDPPTAITSECYAILIIHL